jgi:AbrB family looped-hinge helix DNA binding protein
MAVGSKKKSCCAPGGPAAGCCRVESLVSVDDRGQMVLPKELRDRADIKAGDKLAVVAWEREGAVCCITLIKADALAEQIRGFLGPILGSVLPSK